MGISIKIPAGLIDELEQWVNDEIAHSVAETAFRRDLVVLLGRIYETRSRTGTEREC